jgi:hypothetical protein
MKKHKLLLIFFSLSTIGFATWYLNDNKWSKNLASKNLFNKEYWYPKTPMYSLGYSEGKEDVVNQAIFNIDSVDFNNSPFDTVFYNNGTYEVTVDADVFDDVDNFDNLQYLNSIAELEKGNYKPFQEQTLDLHKILFGKIADYHKIDSLQRIRFDSLIAFTSPKMASVYANQYLTKFKDYNIGLSSSNKYEYYPRADRINEVLATNICRMFELLLEKEAKSALGAMKGLGYDPCSKFLGSVLMPFSEELAQSGMVKDIEINTTTIQNSYSQFIAQLAMVEVSEQINKEKEKFSKVDLWLVEVETAKEKLSLNCFCQCKIGFDLTEQLAIDVNNRVRTITLTLPAPQVVSVDFTPYLYHEKEGGIMKRISNFYGGESDLFNDNDRNEMVNEAKYEARSRANNTENIEMAKKNVNIFFEALFHPFISHPKYPYRLKIDFLPQTETCDYHCDC